MIIDTHAHLTDDRIFLDVKNIIKSFSDDNLTAVVTVGYDRESSDKGVDLSMSFDKVFSAVGIHPHDSRLASNDDYCHFQKVAQNKKVVAVGETGLDYFYDLSERNIQQKVMLEHMELAFNLKLPLIFHLRDAYEDFNKIIKDNKHYLVNGSVLHCYAGSLEMLKEYNKYDMFYSFGGVITFKNFGKSEVIKAIPKDKLLFETDCPYMTPVPHRGKVNYPKYVNLVAQKVAEWRLETQNELEEITTKNAKCLFKRLEI